MEMHVWVTAPLVDAQASEGRTGIGGWTAVLDEEGRPRSLEIQVVQPRDHWHRVAMYL